MNPGFYKVERDMLLYSPTTVESAEYYLNAENPNDHEYPIDGWYWYNSEEEARIFFKLDHYPSQEEVNSVVDNYKKSQNPEEQI